MKFSKEFLLSIQEGGKGEIISDEIVGNSRWSIIHYMVFKYEGKFYGVSYRVGATEMQPERPFEYDDDEIEVTELKQVEKLVTDYIPVKTEVVDPFSGYKQRLNEAERLLSQAYGLMGDTHCYMYDIYGEISDFLNEGLE